MFELTGLEFSPIKLELGWELLVETLGYDPIIAEREEQFETVDNVVVLKAKPIKEILEATINAKVVDYELVNNVLKLKSFNIKQNVYFFPYETKEKNIKVKYIAGFEVDDIPLAFYLAVKELLEIAEDETGGLTSYKIDTIAESYQGVNKFEKVRKLLGGYITESYI